MRCEQYVVQLAVLVFEVVVVTCQQGAWSQWGPWSECSVSCGYGTMNRQKTWLSSRTQDDGEPFKYEDIHECSTEMPCPIDGHWNFWGPWSECTEMCDGGLTRRERECNAPKPQYGGKDCDGKAIVSAPCNDWECPALPPNFDMSWCNETTFTCLSGLQCIPQSRVCDDSLQCHDGSDEHECTNWTTSTGAKFTSMIPATFCLIFLTVLLS